MRKRYKATLALGIASIGILGLVQPPINVEASTSIQSRQYPNVNTYVKQQKLKTAKITQNYKKFVQLDYRNGKGKAEGVVIHETANPNSNIFNEINYMTMNWQNAFVHAFVDKDNIIQIHQADYLAWGAGKKANPRFYQIELVQHNTFHQFAQSVNNDAYLAAYMLHYYNLEPSRATKSGSGTVWTHNEVSQYLKGTNHTDPVGYFAKWGYSIEEFYNLLVEKYNAMPDQIYSETNMNGQYALPVDSKNYGIWSSALSGSKKVGNLSSYDKQHIQVMKKVRTNSGDWYQIAKSGSTIGWVSTRGMQTVTQAATPNESAHNYGVWSNYRYGNRVGGLETYLGKSLTLNKEITLNGQVWVEFSSNGKVVGWVAKNGLAIGSSPNQIPQTVALSGVPVNDAYNYGIYNNYNGGSRVGNLSKYANQRINIDRVVKDLNGNDKVRVVVNSKVIGWVARNGVQVGSNPVQTSGVPAKDAYNYGIWSNYESGKRIGSLSSYSNKEVKIIKEVTASSGVKWIQFSANGKTIGWVAKTGIDLGKKPVITPVVTNGVPVKDAYNYGVWSSYKSGKRIGGLSSYANKEVKIIKEATASDKVKWIQFSVDGKTIGWVAKTGIVLGGKPVLTIGTPVKDAYNFGIWSNYVSGKRVGGLSSYIGKEIKVVKEATASNKVKWVQFSVDGKTIGWVAKTGIQFGNSRMIMNFMMPEPEEIKEPTEEPEIQEPIEIPETQEPIEISETEEPTEVPTEVPEVPEIQEPTEVPEIQEPTEVPEIQEPTEVPEIQEPTEVQKDIILKGSVLEDTEKAEVKNSYLSDSLSVGMLSDFKNKDLEITQLIILDDNSKWVEFKVEDKIVGWTKAETIKIADTIKLDTLIISNDSKVWDKHEKEAKEIGKLVNYLDKEITITQKITLENGKEWFEFSFDKKIIGWVKIESLSFQSK